MALNVHSPEVVELLSDINDLLEQKREALERPQKTFDDTQFVRGQVKTLRWMIEKIKGDPQTDELPG